MQSLVMPDVCCYYTCHVCCHLLLVMLSCHLSCLLSAVTCYLSCLLSLVTCHHVMSAVTCHVCCLLSSAHDTCLFVFLLVTSTHRHIGVRVTFSQYHLTLHCHLCTRALRFTDRHWNQTNKQRSPFQQLVHSLSLIHSLSLNNSSTHSHSHQSCEKVKLLHQRNFRTPKYLHQKCVNRDKFIITKSYKLPKKVLLYS